MNNPPAFPTGTGVTPYNPGMTLRDYFAAKALAGVLAGNERIFYTVREKTMYTKQIYEWADAMLKAREQ